MDWQAAIGAFLSTDASPAVQFLKYALVGGVATAVHIGTFFAAGFLVWPCVGKDDIVVRLLRLKPREVPEELRARRAVYCNVVAFLVANAVCYLLNRAFVFKAGAHAVWLEATLFFAVSALSMGLGTALMGVLIRRFRVQTTWAFGANTVTSLMINYVLRKFVVFGG
ncbi:MAG: GtrA family protein [Kiritimatiellae bacterium]|nr:GtrA family protein [Kiritimatiellia bacterium]